MSFQYEIQNAIPLPFRSLLVVAVIAILFIGLGITREVLAGKQSQAQTDQLDADLQFWIGSNGILLSILVYTVVLLAIVMLVKVIKHLPTWTAVLHQYGSLSVGYINDTTTKISRLAETADALMRDLPVIIKDALVQSALVVSNGKTIVDQMVQTK